MEILNRVKPYLLNYNTYLAFSGGKDSTVLLWKIVKYYPNITIIHNPKKDTHIETIKFIYELSQVYKIINIPSNQMQVYIENNNLNCQIDGTRMCEYNREEKSSNIIIDGKSESRINMKFEVESGIWGIRNIFPIYDWSDEKLFKYIKENDIIISKEYK